MGAQGEGKGRRGSIVPRAQVAQRCHLLANNCCSHWFSELLSLFSTLLYWYHEQLCRFLDLVYRLLELLYWFFCAAVWVFAAPGPKAPGPRARGEKKGPNPREGRGKAQGGGGPREEGKGGMGPKAQ